MPRRPTDPIRETRHVNHPLCGEVAITTIRSGWFGRSSYNLMVRVQRKVDGHVIELQNDTPWTSAMRLTTRALTIMGAAMHWRGEENE